MRAILTIAVLVAALASPAQSQSASVTFTLERELYGEIQSLAGAGRISAVGVVPPFGVTPDVIWQQDGGDVQIIVSALPGAVIVKTVLGTGYFESPEGLIVIHDLPSSVALYEIEGDFGICTAKNADPDYTRHMAGGDILYHYTCK